MRWVFVVLMLFGGAFPAWAQDEAAVVDVAVAPIGCWWQSSTPGARIGERFWVTLTCAVLENGETRVVPDESQLEPAAVQLPPFEVVEGQRGNDRRTGQRRFFQYRYQVRLIAENQFATDAYVPALAISYTVETRVGGNEALQGREQTYTMPPLPIRIHSLVPRDATDIRSTAGAPALADIDRREFRADLLRVTALVLFTVAGLLVLIAAIGAMRRGRAHAPEASHLLSGRTVIRGVGRELAEVARRRQIEGWTPDLSGRALTALRIAAAFAAGATVSQHAAGRHQAAKDGQLAVTGGFPRRTTSLVSASSTATSVATDGPGKHSGTESRDLEGIRGALTAFTAARYGRDESPDDGTLDEALAAGRQTLERVAAAHTMAAEATARVKRRVEASGIMAWSR